MAKLLATETAQYVVDAAVQLHGARALCRGHLLEHLYREVRAPRIYEGASEVQRGIIARELYAELAQWADHGEPPAPAGQVRRDAPAGPPDRIARTDRSAQSDRAAQSDKSAQSDRSAQPGRILGAEETAGGGLTGVRTERSPHVAQTERADREAE